MGFALIQVLKTIQKLGRIIYVLDLLLVMTLGFLGSFGHCAGMCGPLAVAFSLSKQSEKATWQQNFAFQFLLNLGRLASYGLLGAAIGGVGSILFAGGQLAGIDSVFRQGMSLLTGILLIWFGFAQVKPNFLPHLPLLHPLTQGKLHQHLSSAMMQLSLKPQWWTPALLGIFWGLIPCGFLYAAQIKAAETGSFWVGGATMLAFGLGTLPVMLSVGVFTSALSADRRSQLFQAAGWVTIAIGVLSLLRTGEMVDFTGYAALICLMLALVARPLSRIWSLPLRYRRVLGVGAFVLAIAHTAHTLEHTFAWNLSAVSFMIPLHQVSMFAGSLALVLMAPAALTSHDRWMKQLGNYWRRIHLLSIPALIFCGVHVVLIGARYLGGLEWYWQNYLQAGLLGIVVLGVLLVRSRQFWTLLSLEKFYVSPVRPQAAFPQPTLSKTADK
jgi:uncharacterized protein